MCRIDRGHPAQAAPNEQCCTYAIDWLHRRQARRQASRLLQGKLTFLLDLLHHPKATSAERTTILEAMGGILLETVVGGQPCQQYGKGRQ